MNAFKSKRIKIPTGILFQALYLDSIVVEWNKIKYTCIVLDLGRDPEALVLPIHFFIKVEGEKTKQV